MILIVATVIVICQSVRVSAAGIVFSESKDNGLRRPSTW